MIWKLVLVGGIVLFVVCLSFIYGFWQTWKQEQDAWDAYFNK